MGPKASAGKKDNAATIMITANTMIPKVLVSVFSVPADSGTNFFFASMPAMAIGPIIGKKRDISMTRPQVIFQKGTPSPRPSKPEPLFAEEEVNSYSISENPWLPGLFSHPAYVFGSAAYIWEDNAVNAKIRSVCKRAMMVAI